MCLCLCCPCLTMFMLCLSTSQPVFVCHVLVCSSLSSFHAIPIFLIENGFMCQECLAIYLVVLFLILQRKE